MKKCTALMLGGTGEGGSLVASLRAHWASRGETLCPVLSFLAPDVSLLFERPPAAPTHVVNTLAAAGAVLPDALLPASNRRELVSVALWLRQHCTSDLTPSWLPAVEQLWSERRPLAAVLVAVAHVEDALHEVVAQRLPCSRERPKKLGDSLAALDLASVVGGQGEATVVLALLAPFAGFNLRNVAWHGFLTHLDPSLAALALTMLGDLHRLLVAQWSRAPLPKLLDWAAAEAPHCQAPVALAPAQLAALAHGSYFPLPGTQALWADALGLACERPVQGLAALMPLLEHALRRVYVVANDCDSSASLCTASSEELYTTLDILLAPQFRSAMSSIVEDRKDARPSAHRDATVPNGALAALGGPWGARSGVLLALMDSLIWDPAMRLRDILAHGRVDWDDGSAGMFTVAQWFVALLAALLFRFRFSACAPSMDSVGALCEKHFETVYFPRHHPLAELQRALVDAGAAANTWVADYHHERVPAVGTTSELEVALMARGCFGVVQVAGKAPAFVLQRGLVDAGDDRSLNTWTALTPVARLVQQLFVAVPAALARLTEQAKTRRQKRDTLAVMRAHEGAFGAFLLNAFAWLSARISDDHVWRSQERVMFLFNITGRLLGCLSDGKGIVALHVLAAHVGKPDLVNPPSLLNAKEIASLTLAL